MIDGWIILDITIAIYLAKILIEGTEWLGRSLKKNG